MTVGEGARASATLRFVVRRDTVIIVSVAYCGRDVAKELP